MLTYAAMPAVLWAAPTSAALPLVGVRIGCISAAIFVVTFLSIFIYPQVASEQVCQLPLMLRPSIILVNAIKLNSDRDYIWE